jgi:hypothetical protein
MHEPIIHLNDRPERKPAVEAILFSSIIFLIAEMLISPYRISTYLQACASSVLANHVYSPAFSLSLLFAAGLAVHFIVSTAYGIALISVIHNWGIGSATFAGAIFGHLLYFINYHGLDYLFPLFTNLRSWETCLNLTLFGANLALVYKFFSKPTHVSDPVMVRTS